MAEKVCVVDGTPLKGQQKRYCSRKCRDAAYWKRKQEVKRKVKRMLQS